LLALSGQFSVPFCTVFANLRVHSDRPSQLHGSRLTTVSHSVSPIHARSSLIQTLQHPLVTFVAVAWTEEADQLSISAAYTWVLTKTNIVTISYWWKHTSLLFYC